MKSFFFFLRSFSCFFEDECMLSSLSMLAFISFAGYQINLYQNNVAKYIESDFSFLKVNKSIYFASLTIIWLVALFTFRMFFSLTRTGQNKLATHFNIVTHQLRNTALNSQHGLKIERIQPLLHICKQISREHNF